MANKFMSATRKLPYMFKEPDEDILQPKQLAYFQDYINGLESRLYSGTWLSSREYASLSVFPQTVGIETQLRVVIAAVASNLFPNEMRNHRLFVSRR